jgi:hypothetical protein
MSLFHTPIADNLSCREKGRRSIEAGRVKLILLMLLQLKYDGPF